MKWSEVIDYYTAKSNELANDKNSKTKFIVASYNKFINTVKSSIDDPLSRVTNEKVNSLNISDHMKSRIIYFKDNPNEMLVKYDSKKSPLKDQLLKLLGIGEVKADELINAGLKTIAQLKTKKFQALLTSTSQQFLQYKPDREIPHDNIKKVEPSILSLCDQKDGCVSTILVGSYRRNTKTSRDIDVMIVSDSPDILDIFLKKAQSTYGESNVIVYAHGKDKISLLVCFNNIELFKTQNLGVYKLDVFRSPIAQAASMMLYATGSKEHNILMRKNAKNKNMLLNQEGLYERDTGKLIPTNSENEIFEKIGMTYKEPAERV